MRTGSRNGVRTGGGSELDGGGVTGLMRRSVKEGCRDNGGCLEVCVVKWRGGVEE